MAQLSETRNVWQVRNMDEDTKKKVKMYAVEHDLTIAQAIEQLIKLALESQ